MRRKKTSVYDAHESKILQESSAFAEFLTRKGLLEDHSIDNEKVRKAKKSTTQKAYHNTEVLLEQYRTITWILDCVPEDLSSELHVPQNNLEALASRIDVEMSLENKRLQNKLTSAMKTKLLVDRIHDALGVLKKKPDNGEDLYRLIYNQYIDPVRRKSEELVDMMHVSSRTYYRMRSEAISVLSIRLWSAPSSYIDDWLEILTIMENM